MPEFNRPYTYGKGEFSYVVEFRNGFVSLTVREGQRWVDTPEAIRWHLSEVTKSTGFRYLD